MYLPSSSLSSTVLPTNQKIWFALIYASKLDQEKSCLMLKLTGIANIVTLKEENNDCWNSRFAYLAKQNKTKPFYSREQNQARCWKDTKAASVAWWNHCGVDFTDPSECERKEVAKFTRVIKKPRMHFLLIKLIPSRIGFFLMHGPHPVICLPRNLASISDCLCAHSPDRVRVAIWEVWLKMEKRSWSVAREEEELTF